MNLRTKIKKSMNSISINKSILSCRMMAFIASLIFIFSGANLNAQCERRAMACNNRLNIPLNENCEAIITIDMILEDQVGADSDYELRIFDPEGDLIMSDTLREDYDCQPLKVEVECLSSGIYCWGYIVIEDKIKPSLTISPLDTAVTCNIYDFQLDPNALVTDVSFSDQGSCEKPDSLGITDFKLTDFPVCSDTVAVINRFWTVVDKSKFMNDSTVMQTIYLLRARFSDFEYPRDTVIDCRDVGDLSVEALGEPELKSCRDYFDVIFDESEFPTCGGAKKISRRWRIFDTCRGTDTLVTQNIEIIDTSGAIIDFSEFDIPANKLIPSKEECISSAKDIANPIITDCSVIQPNQLRAWYQFTDAMGMPFGFRFDAYINDMETFDLRDVPIGQDFVVIFEVTDSCNNVSTGTSGVFRAEDTTDPNAVCESSTIVAINSSGLTEVTAASLDDHSFDNCGIVRREIRRIDSACDGFASDLTLGNSVHFCCEDVANNPIKVLLRVYDANDNSSDCIIDVVVQDKRVPLITCPNDLDLPCDTDLDDLEATIRANGLPSVTWICGEGDITVDIPDVTVSSCGFAAFTVTWTATDANGAASSCIQSITIDDLTPININYPASEITVTNCNGGITPEDLANSSPTISNIDCEQLAITYEDLPFVLNDTQDDYCQKIQRNWTIIDWCAFDNGNISTATIGTFEQFILIQDNQAPVFNNLPQDFELSDDDGDCLQEVVITVSASDDCSADDELTYTYDIDIDGDEIGDEAGEGNVMSRTFAPGSYSVVFTATDQCGNVGESDRISFEIASTKAPIPLIQGLYRVNIQANGSVSLLASDMNIKSTQGCTDSEEGLFFAFSSDPNDAIMTFDCADIANGITDEIEVEVFVIDERGNFNSTSVFITVSDINFNACTDNISQVAISGTVTDEDSRGVANIAVSTFNPTTNSFEEVMTDDNGRYALADLDSYEDYVVEANLDGFDLTGVTTLDVVLIQRHILGMTPLESPYKVIAADINNSGSISGSDLAELRKLILGTRPTLGQDNSWKFIDKNYQFADDLSPWEYPEMAEVVNIISDASGVDFIGLKIGDVNGNAFGALAQQMAGTRAIGSMEIKEIHTDNQSIYELAPTNDENIFGLQFSMEYDADHMQLLEIEGLGIDANNYSIIDNKINLSWSSADAVTMSAENPIRLIFSTMDNQGSLTLSDKGLLNEYYTSTFETKEIKLIEVETVQGAFVLEQNVPNPFSTLTQIRFELPEAGRVAFDVTDMSGQLIMSSADYFAKGNNTITIDANDMAGSGVYYYTLTTDAIKETRRMIIIY